MIARLPSAVLLAGAIALLVHGERLKATGTLDGDPFSAYAAVVLSSSLLLSRGTPRLYAVTLAFVLAASSRNLLLVGLAIAVVGFSTAGRRAAVAAAVLLLASVPLLGHADIARIEDPSAVGMAALIVGLLATWLAVHWSVFAKETYDPSESPHVSFACLVAVSACVVRAVAWHPDETSFRALLPIASGGLLWLGALGVFFAEDRRNLVRWALLSQAGLFCLFALGGVQARPALLAQWVVSGLAIHALAHARDRLLLVVGALALVSPPPLPGFAFKLVAANAVLAEGRGGLLVALLPAVGLLGAGALRFAWRRPDDEDVPRRWLSPVGLAVAFAAFVALGPWAEPLWALAAFAASGLF